MQHCSTTALPKCSPAALLALLAVLAVLLCQKSNSVNQAQQKKRFFSDFSERLLLFFRVNSDQDEPIFSNPGGEKERKDKQQKMNGGTFIYLHFKAGCFGCNDFSTPDNPPNETSFPEKLAGRKKSLKGNKKSFRSNNFFLFGLKS